MGPVNLSIIPVCPSLELNGSLQAMYALLGAGKEDRFSFAFSGKEATRQILLSHYFETIKQTGKNHILLLPSSETISQSCMKELQLLGCSTKTLPLNAQGQLTREALIQSISPRSSLLSLSWAHGLTGVIQPLDEIAAVCKEQGIHLHVDVTSALGKLFFRFQGMEVDYLSLDGALLGAPHGTGGMLIQEEIVFASEEIPPLEGLKALVSTLDVWMHHFDHLSTETARLRDLFEKQVVQEINDAHVLFSHVERLPNTSVIVFPGIAAETLQYLLQRKGIYTSCGGEYFPSLSSILMSYGEDPQAAHSALSFSLSYQTTEEEIHRTIEQIVQIVKKAQSWSKELL